jgi:hypothetical protein
MNGSDIYFYNSASPQFSIYSIRSCCGLEFFSGGGSWFLPNMPGMLISVGKPDRMIHLAGLTANISIGGIATTRSGARDSEDKPARQID